MNLNLQELEWTTEQYLNGIELLERVHINELPNLIVYDYHCLIGRVRLSFIKQHLSLIDSNNNEICVEMLKLISSNWNKMLSQLN